MCLFSAHVSQLETVTLIQRLYYQQSSYLENVLDFQWNLVEEREIKMVAGKKNHKGLKIQSLLPAPARTYKPPEQTEECNTVTSSVDSAKFTFSDSLKNQDAAYCI